MIGKGSMQPAATGPAGRLVAAVLLGWCAACALPATQAAPPVALQGVRLRIAGDFALPDKKTRRSASGVACTGQGADRLCLVAFDEGGEVRHARLQGDRWLPQPRRVVLLQPTGAGGKVELDAEGAATDGRYHYVTGSHTVKRGDCKANPDSARVMRFPVGTSDGGGAPGMPAGLSVSDRLTAIMQAQPALKDHVGKCLGTSPPEKRESLQGGRGVDIEGLAVAHGRLYFGFRGPSVDGEVPLLAVETEPFFAGGDARPVVTRVRVGAHQGIRDLQAVADGLLLLVGPDDDKPVRGEGEWSVALLDGRGLPGWPGAAAARAEPRVLARLDLAPVRSALGACDKEVKPEAISVLAEEAGRYRLLVLSDGLCDGGPLVYDVPRAGKP